MSEKSKRTLLVEDDPLISNIYHTSLERAGYEVETVVNGARVLSKLREGEYDLLLLDLVLPEKSGFEVLRELNREGLNENLKVVILSNLGQKEKVDKALEMGVERYLVKAHYTPKEVVAEIRKVMEE